MESQQTRFPIIMQIMIMQIMSRLFSIYFLFIAHSEHFTFSFFISASKVFWNKAQKIIKKKKNLKTDITDSLCAVFNQFYKMWKRE